MTRTQKGSRRIQQPKLENVSSQSAWVMISRMDNLAPKSTIGRKFRLYILVTKAYEGGGPGGEIPLANCACFSKPYQPATKLSDHMLLYCVSSHTLWRRKPAIHDFKKVEWTGLRNEDSTQYLSWLLRVLIRGGRQTEGSAYLGYNNKCCLVLIGLLPSTFLFPST